MKGRRCRSCLWFALLLPALDCIGQESSSQSQTISTVVNEAGKNYPSIRISQEELNAAASRLNLARTAYLPRVDALAQFNRATRNNVFGSLLPQSVIPSMSGPVIGTNNGGSVWGSATGLLINWQPFDFGLRQANVKAAASARDAAAAARERTELEITAASADAFLAELAALSTRTAADAAVKNWETLRTSIHALVTSQLRPGADESRVEAEKAAAVTLLALAEEAVASAQATVKKFAPSSATFAPAVGRFATDLPDLGSVDAPLVAGDNPVVIERHAAVEQNAAQLQASRRTWVPQFNLEGTGYARGTGAETNGVRLGGTNGLAPNIGNYAAGVNITFPIMDFASVHAREAERAADLHAASANEELTRRVLQEQFEQAQAALRGAKTIAENTPIQSRAAQTAFDQASARYKAGLAAIDDVAQAQRLLVQAQIDDAVARLNAWRAFLQLQFVRGDLQPFLDQAGRQ